MGQGFAKAPGTPYVAQGAFAKGLGSGADSPGGQQAERRELVTKPERGGVGATPPLCF
jgi:hypothetical protein